MVYRHSAPSPPRRPAPYSQHRGSCWPLGAGSWWESWYLLILWQELCARPLTFPGLGFSGEGGEVLNLFDTVTPFTLRKPHIWVNCKIIVI